MRGRPAEGVQLGRAEHLLAGGPLDGGDVAQHAEHGGAEDVRVDGGDRVEVAQRGRGQRRQLDPRRLAPGGWKVVSPQLWGGRRRAAEATARLRAAEAALQGA